MNYNNVKLTCTAGTASQLPQPGRAEVAFVGRSNVGKSSLLNKLFNRKNLVKVSSKPGKTTTINFFAVDGVDFVDLPGYGFAKVSASEQDRWNKLMDGYFEPNLGEGGSGANHAGPRNIRLVVALVDIRHDASKLDYQMIDYLAELELPYAIAFTKADKLSRSKALQQVKTLRKQLDIEDEVPDVMCSATAGTGIGELKALIEKFI